MEESTGAGKSEGRRCARLFDFSQRQGRAGKIIRSLGLRRKGERREEWEEGGGAD